MIAVLRSSSLCALLALPLALLAQNSLPKPKAQHVVLCVWDGMRPDFITPEHTPTLHAFAQRGTFFANNHSFYVTTTEVNGTVLATGAFPQRSGILANREYRPAINLMKAVSTEAAHTIRVGDALADGKYVDALTVAEIVQKAGHRTAVAGTKPIALLHDRGFDRTDTHGSVVLFAGKTYPEAFLKAISSPLGKFPPYPDTAVSLEESEPNTAQNSWTTRAFTEVLWKDEVPKYSVLWLGDPDFSQHLTAPGHPTALAAIRDCDTHFAAVLAALEAKGVTDSTNVFVVSDHGFSTVAKAVDLVATFRKAGLAATKEFKMTPKPDEVLIVNVGGSTSVYVIGKSTATIQKIVDLLQGSEFAGPIFTREGLPGTFTLADGYMGAEHAPDVVFSFRTLPGLNKYGAPGLIYGEGKRPGFGTHGTLGESDIRNTLVAAGPDIRAGFRNELPTGNIDVVPTMLHLLGLAAPVPSDGRVLTEALAGTNPPAGKPITTRMEATRSLGAMTWRQSIQTTTFGERTYFDHGTATVE